MIAHYTRRMMRDLGQYGETSHWFGPLMPESVARSRIQNAARRAGLKVRTRKVDYGERGTFILAEVVQ